MLNSACPHTMFKFGKSSILKIYKSRNFVCKAIYRLETTSIVKSSNDRKELFEKKMKFYMKTYEDLFGITKLTEMQGKVIEVQFKLQDIQEKRRQVQEEIFAVQKKLQEMQDILHKTSMGDDMYISVVSQVRELLKEQKRLQDVFSLYDQTEREQQMTLALAINNSQDQERTYREKNKYLSLITGIVGGILGLLGSSINNWRHRKDIKHFAQDIFNEVKELKHSVEKLKAVFGAGEASETSSGGKEAENLLATVKSQQATLQDNVTLLQSMLSDKSLLTSDNVSNQSFGESLSMLEKNIEAKFKLHSYIDIGLVGSLILLSVLFLAFSGGPRL